MLHFQDDKLGRVSTAASHLPRPQNAFRLPAFPLLPITVTHNAFLQDQECLPVRTDRHLQVNAALQRWRQKLQSCYELKKKNYRNAHEDWRCNVQIKTQSEAYGLIFYQRWQMRLNIILILILITNKDIFILFTTEHSSNHSFLLAFIKRITQNQQVRCIGTAVFSFRKAGSGTVFSLTMDFNDAEFALSTLNVPCTQRYPCSRYGGTLRQQKLKAALKKNDRTKGALHRKHSLSASKFGDRRWTAHMMCTWEPHGIHQYVSVCAMGCQRSWPITLISRQSDSFWTECTG